MESGAGKVKAETLPQFFLRDLRVHLFKITPMSELLTENVPFAKLVVPNPDLCIVRTVKGERPSAELAAHYLMAASDLYTLCSDEYICRLH